MVRPGSRTSQLLIATHTFSGDRPDDLSFVKGEQLIGLRLNGQWWNGRKSNGETGYFPSNHVKNNATPSAPPGTDDY